MVIKVRTDSSGNLTSWYRHISKGVWPFSTPDNGWPISDYTSEGLKAAHVLSCCSPDIVREAIPVDRIYDAVNMILSLQNTSGGFASYEITRSYPWLEVRRMHFSSNSKPSIVHETVSRT